MVAHNTRSVAISVPEWVEPMAATLTQERFTGPEWIFEHKLDGIRLLAFKDGRNVRLLSRNRLPLNASYPAVADAIAELPVHDVILDGEATGVWGKACKVAYHVFDILWLDGRVVMSLPLDERRALLNRLPLRAPLRRVPPLDDPKPWERACNEGWEGVIAKRRDAPYEHRRSPHWLKMKCEATQELVVGGFTDPRGARVGLGALLVGYYEGGARVVLRRDCAGDAAAHPRAAGHDGAVPGRYRAERVSAERRRQGFSRVAAARRGSQEGRNGAPPARLRCAIPRLACEPEQH